MPEVHDFLAVPPTRLPEELVATLLEGRRFRLERIVSQGHASPPGFWYDQDEEEWVLVVAGRARLRLAERDEPLEMTAGSFLHLPAHCRHRVEWTDPQVPTIWLAVFFEKPLESPAVSPT